MPQRRGSLLWFWWEAAPNGGDFLQVMQRSRHLISLSGMSGLLPCFDRNRSLDGTLCKPADHAGELR